MSILTKEDYNTEVRFIHSGKTINVPFITVNNFNINEITNNEHFADGIINTILPLTDIKPNQKIHIQKIRIRYNNKNVFERENYSLYYIRDMSDIKYR